MTNKHHVLFISKIIYLYKKKSEKIVKATFNEYMGFIILLGIIALSVNYLMNNTSIITNRASILQNTFAQNGFWFDLSTLTTIVWFFILSYLTILYIFSWAFYKLYFRTPVRKWIKKRELEFKRQVARKAARRSKD